MYFCIFLFIMQLCPHNFKYNSQNHRHHKKKDRKRNSPNKGYLSQLHNLRKLSIHVQKLHFFEQDQQRYANVQDDPGDKVCLLIWRYFHVLVVQRYNDWVIRKETEDEVDDKHDELESDRVGQCVVYVIEGVAKLQECMANGLDSQIHEFGEVPNLV